MDPKNNKLVLIVHAIDTEGPLHESVEAKFERLRDLFNINVSPTEPNLEKLRKGEMNLGGKEKEVQKVLESHLANYNDSWEKIDEMLSRLMSQKFRNAVPDSFGGGWVFNWHCMDHVGYLKNPRKRDVGFHKIFDHYRDFLKNNPDCPDAIHWHFHPMSTYREAHRCATSYFNSDEIFQILCRKLIERRWFPSVYRAGFQTERPDSHWFLEQWIPFDISNMALDDNSELENTIDFRKGRSGNWRLAPSDWSVYHPSHDNYQLPGSCRRWIGRALNVMNRLASIDATEMEKAFARAENLNQPTLVGLAGHDWRNLEAEVVYLQKLISDASKKYPEVRFKYCEGIEAFRKAIWSEDVSNDPLELDLQFYPETLEDCPSIKVSTIKGKVFGPQPFLAMETKSNRFIHDNFDFDSKPGNWFYAFHADTLSLSDIKSVAVGANDEYGNTCIKQMDFK
ncbi:MAG: hypothetical protein HOK41_10740 [Nitrospina sp.]|nr:hypothetical protein [Nitrospina sp.]